MDGDQTVRCGPHHHSANRTKTDSEQIIQSKSDVKFLADGEGREDIKLRSAPTPGIQPINNTGESSPEGSYWALYCGCSEYGDDRDAIKDGTGNRQIYEIKE